jgi:hypothetical protein
VCSENVPRSLAPLCENYWVKRSTSSRRPRLCIYMDAISWVSTYMVRACSRDSHTGEGMLDHSIRGSLAPSISLEFYGWTDTGDRVAKKICGREELNPTSRLWYHTRVPSSTNPNIKFVMMVMGSVG